MGNVNYGIADGIAAGIGHVVAVEVVATPQAADGRPYFRSVIHVGVVAGRRRRRLGRSGGINGRAEEARAERSRGVARRRRRRLVTAQALVHPRQFRFAGVTVIRRVPETWIILNQSLINYHSNCNGYKDLCIMDPPYIHHICIHGISINGWIDQSNMDG